jgi:hypothetical protein
LTSQNTPEKGATAMKSIFQTKIGVFRVGFPVFSNQKHVWKTKKRKTGLKKFFCPVEKLII